MLTDAEQKRLLENTDVIRDFLEDKPTVNDAAGDPSYDNFGDRRRFILLPNRVYLIEKDVRDIKKKLGA